MTLRGTLSAACGLLFAAVLCSAQSTNASIYGTITDSSGAVISKSNVIAVNSRTGVSLSTVSNDSGVYIFPSLQPGEYSVSAESAGFRKAVAQKIQLDVSARITVDLKLEIGATAESVTVESTAGPLETVNTSVSNVVSLQRVQDLPLQNRDAGSLVALQAGVVGDNFNGVRSQSQNVTLEGVSVQETRYNGGQGNLTTTNSVDRVAEFRVSMAPADAEFGRGMAQVQMIGRSGTNEFHGSAFEFNRVTALSANSWFNNQLGRNSDGSLVAPRNFLIRNQFGVRVGAPIIRNKTFVFFLYEGQRQKTKSPVNNTVFTQQARNGIFRFYPGVRNANATAAIPTVDLNGNPVTPTGAQGDLQSVSLFGRDPNRLVADPTGQVTKALKDYPLPNNFLRGDGLNTGGYYWQQPGTSDYNMYNVRLDHVLTNNTRLAFSMQLERSNSFNGYRGQVFPDQPSDSGNNKTNFYTLSASSTLRPNLLNDFRVGVNRFTAGYTTPFDADKNSALPHVGTQPFFFIFQTVTNTYTSNNAPQGRISPLYQYSDSVTWLKGRHAFKGGGEVRFDSSNGYNSFYALPGATTGAGNVPFTNLSTIPGIGNNVTTAQTMLGDLAGALASWTQAFNSAGGKNPTYIPGEPVQRTWRQREYNGYFKDDWKLSRTITLNLGLRYEYYSPPAEANGKAAVPINGTAGAFGISGTSYADAYQPGRLNGKLTELVLVGGKSNYPDRSIYNKDYKTFLPAVGISWAVNDKTVLRGGFAMTSDRNSLRNADTEAGSNPGMNSTITFNSATAMNVSNVGVPFAPSGQAMSIVPLSDRTQILRIFETGLRNQRYQNWNISMQRQITKDSVFTVRYVGTKGSRLLSGVDLNQGEIFANGFVDAFNVTRAGGQSPLFDKMFAGLTVPGQGPVNGTTARGSDYVRSNSTFTAFLANGNVGAFANNLNASKLVGNTNGGLLAAAGLPENFFMTNPQFATVYLVGNHANSTYHAMQVEFEKRFSRGWVYQGNYTWSKALGENELGGTQYYDNSYRNPKNRSFDKRIMTFNRTHVFKSNGIWELPVGKKRKLLSNANRIVDGAIGGWKVSGILTMTSGRPFTVTAPVSTFTKSTTGNTPDVGGVLGKDLGQLQFDGRGACYFCGFKQSTDPSIALLTPALASQSTLFAQTSPDGVVLKNPLPGTLGNLAQTFFSGPSSFNVDAALTKQFRITERFDAEFRTDWLNAANHPDFSGSTIDSSINSANFGRITGSGATGRIIVVSLRLNW